MTTLRKSPKATSQPDWGVPLLDMDAYVKAVVDQAPPPCSEQLARLRLILCGSSRTNEEAADVAA